MEIVWQTPANPPEAQDYIFRHGRRFVRPYYFEFIAHVKVRWTGKTIVDLFTEEFKGRPYEYYVAAVKSGRIQVDEQMVSTSYRVQSSQKISHFLHRHEPPVLAWDMQILQIEDNIITVCKPPSVPVHPCGQYRKNTVVGILQAEHNLTPLFPVHRLDRLVSGLLILARNPTKADTFRQLIEAGKVQKQYVAKVVGIFPEKEVVVNANVDYDAREGRSTVEVEDNRMGKPACTKFTRLSTNGEHSIVLCEPITGRTHQIRVHLQYTGYPIGNDVLYLSEVVCKRSTLGTGADRAATFVNSEDLDEADPNCDSNSTGVDAEGNEDFRYDPMCTNCPDLAPKGYDGLDQPIWLHCVKYSGPDWEYECPHPAWAIL